MLQHFGRIFEFFVLQQAIHQLLARIVAFALSGQGRVLRQQHFGLDVDQGGRHIHKFGAQIDVHLAGLFHVLKILGCNLCDRNVANVDLLPANQVQQEVERAFILLQMKVQGR